MMRYFRLLRIKCELDRNLRARKAITRARSEAARRGTSTYWKRSGERCRAMFKGAGA